MSLFSFFSKYIVPKKAKESLPGAHPLRYCVQRREAPQCTRLEGSLTVEAAVIIPLFATFFSFLLFYFRIMNVQLVVQEALEEIGRGLSVLSVKELEEPDEEIDYLVLAKGRLYFALKEEEVILRYVKGGALGVSLLMSDFEQDSILLRANYVMRFPITFFGNQDFWMSQAAYYRKWTGWKGIEDESVLDGLVYITKYGEVYHVRRSCPYLALTIRKIMWKQLETERNKGGERYRECELCCDKTDFMDHVYITDYGDKYHYTITCGGLKRIIYQKRFSEVGGMPACGKCAK